MIEFQNSVRINRPATEVFAFLIDLENLPKWDNYVLEVTKVSSGPVGVGSVYRQIRVTDVKYLVIAELDQDQRLVVKTLYPFSLGFEMAITVQDAGPSTIVQEGRRLETGLVEPMESFGLGRLKTAAAENLTKLKEVLEEGQVVLHDGRLEQRRNARRSVPA